MFFEPRVGVRLGRLVGSVRVDHEVGSLERHNVPRGSSPRNRTSHVVPFVNVRSVCGNRVGDHHSLMFCGRPKGCTPHAGLAGLILDSGKFFAFEFEWHYIFRPGISLLVHLPEGGFCRNRTTGGSIVGGGRLRLRGLCIRAPRERCFLRSWGGCIPGHCEERQPNYNLETFGIHVPSSTCKVFRASFYAKTVRLFSLATGNVGAPILRLAAVCVAEGETSLFFRACAMRQREQIPRSYSST